MNSRLVFTLILLMVFCSCGQKVPKDNSETQPEINVNTELKKFAEFTGWERQQDSIRTSILKSKTNEVLKNSFLQEMYIRNVVTTSNDSAWVLLPFDLHAPDCGAPDCYTTDVSFSLIIGDTLVFPVKLPFQEHEHGCVEKESRLSGSFQLIENTYSHVIYYSEKPKRTLVLFRSNIEVGTTAYYFTGLDKKRMNGENIYTITREYNIEDENPIYPMMSWILSTSEYESFLK